MADVMASSKSLLRLQNDEAQESEVITVTDSRSTNGNWDLGSSTPKILHKTIDFNPFLMNSSSVLSDSDQEVVKRYLEKETKKKSLVRKERREDEDENVGGIDLGLKLSPPNGYNLPKGSQSKSTSSQEPNCASKYFYVNINERDSASVASKVEISSLVLMGCTNCLMYIMVPQVEPKCPKCMSSVLLDIFRENPSSAKRLRKS